jgi:hypothetical protein
MRSNKELAQELRTAPASWMDTAIVVAFDNHFEFVSESHPDPAHRLDALELQGGLAIGLAGIQPTGCDQQNFLAEVFKEYEGQAWALQSMDKLRRIIACRCV